MRGPQCELLLSPMFRSFMGPNRGIGLEVEGGEVINIPIKSPFIY
jgi:hypothetical protein